VGSGDPRLGAESDFTTAIKPIEQAGVVVGGTTARAAE